MYIGVYLLNALSKMRDEVAAWGEASIMAEDNPDNAAER